MSSPYTHCRKCRRPILVAETWESNYLCPACRAVVLKQPKQKLPEYRVKMVTKKQPVINKEDLYFIVVGILGLIGLYLLVIL